MSLEHIVKPTRKGFQVENFRVKLTEDFSDLLQTKDFWNNLLGWSLDNSPFQTFEWLTSWWKSFGAGKRLYVLVAYQNEDEIPVGVAPLMQTKNKNLRVLKFIAHGISDYPDFICDKNHEEVIKSFLFFLNEHKQDWDLIVLRDIPSKGNYINFLDDLAKGFGFKIVLSRSGVYPFIPLIGSWNSYLSLRSSHWRRILKQKETRIIKDGIKYQIKCLSPDAFTYEIFEDIIKIEKNSWKIKAGAAKIQKEDQKYFYFSFLSEFAKKEWLNLWLCYFNEKPVAYLINFDYNQKIWVYNIAYDENFSHYSPGTILIKYALEDAFRRGKKEFDFMRGDEEFKSRWTSEKRESYQLIFYRKSLRSLVAYFLLFQARQTLIKQYGYFKKNICFLRSLLI